MAMFSKRWRSLLLLALAVAVGVAFATMRTAMATAAGGAPRFTAAEIADGVLFNDGPAARYLTNLNRGPTQWTDSIRETQRGIHDGIAADPRWADAFVANMQSGDPRRVSQGMSDLGVIARRTLDRQFDPRKVDDAIWQIDKEWAEQHLVHAAVLDAEFNYDTGADTWFETDTAVAVDKVAVVVIAVVLAIVLLDFSMPEFSDRAQLAHEVMVKDIAEGLQQEAGY